jgi:hypothetical protein
VISDASDAGDEPRTDLNLWFEGLNDAPPLRLSVLVALQHVLTVFVGVARAAN